MEAPGDPHGGLAFGGVPLAMCTLELGFPATVADQLPDGASGKRLTRGSQHTACAVPQPNGGLCAGIDFDRLQICSRCIKCCIWRPEAAEEPGVGSWVALHPWNSFPAGFRGRYLHRKRVWML